LELHVYLPFSHFLYSLVQCNKNHTHNWYWNIWCFQSWKYCRK
jgi:hypothetical protein